LRILFLSDLSDPRIGSSVRQIHELGERLRELGHETALATAVQDPAETGERQVGGLRVFPILSDYDVRYRGFVSLSNPRVREPMRRVLETFRPDVVHANLVHTHLSYASLTAARDAGAGVVFTAHDVMTFCYQKLTCFHGGLEHAGSLRDYQAYWQKCIPCQRLRWNPWRNRSIRRVLARDVDRFVAVSAELATAIRANRIRVDRVIHNAIRPKASGASGEEVAAFRRRFGLEGRRVLAIAGRLSEPKGVFQILEVLARLGGEFPDLRLLAMGRTEAWEREFAPAARALGVGDRVVTTGWLEGSDLEAAYAATDVLATPSTCFDTFGLVNLEAMQHGKPVVATLFGGSPEVVRDGATGFVENPYDVPAFAARVGELLRDPELRARLGEAGRRRLLERFTIDRLATEYLEEYERARAAAARVHAGGAAGR
jgi:glycosyltransferase involved in cell wall biosynthesis